MDMDCPYHKYSGNPCLVPGVLYHHVDVLAVSGVFIVSGIVVVMGLVNCVSVVAVVLESV